MMERANWSFMHNVVTRDGIVISIEEGPGYIVSCNAVLDCESMTYLESRLE